MIVSNDTKHDYHAVQHFVRITKLMSIFNSNESAYPNRFTSLMVLIIIG